ncbi:hypothetical protein VNO78_31091 [Psophocarpus tetragonolobus]|uniref:Uncharacterized protein n=1 Tax=Psophocarpus tetragonolobus TaxID=3891 RepID=A0AAN9RXT8_PSOTE
MRVLSVMAGQHIRKCTYLPSFESFLTFKGIAFWDLSTCRGVGLEPWKFVEDLTIEIKWILLTNKYDEVGDVGKCNNGSNRKPWYGTAICLSFTITDTHSIRRIFYVSGTTTDPVLH